MNMVTLGNTGLRVSAISFGGIPIQRSDAANTLAVVDELEKCGINFLDTARAHHAGECVECGACESRCPYELPIREMPRDVAKEFGC